MLCEAEVYICCKVEVMDKLHRQESYGRSHLV